MTHLINKVNVNTFSISNPLDTFRYLFVPNALTAEREIELPLLVANDSFVFEDHSQTLTNKVLMAPDINKIVSGADDMILFTGTASAVNHVELKNAVSTEPPTLSAIGADINIDINVAPKGLGSLSIAPSVGSAKIKLYDASGGENIVVQVPSSITSSYSLTYPPEQSASRRSLVNNGSGTLSWSLSAIDTKENTYYAGDFINPVTADWPVNALAAAVADPNNSAITSRIFRGIEEQGVGFSMFIPTGYTRMTLSYVSRGTGLAGNVKPTLRYRTISDNSSIGIWRNHVLTALAMPAASTFQYDEQVILFTTFFPSIITNTEYQFEFTRDSLDPADTLTGNWFVYSLKVSIE